MRLLVIAMIAVATIVSGCKTPGCCGKCKGSSDAAAVEKCKKCGETPCKCKAEAICAKCNMPASKCKCKK